MDVRPSPPPLAASAFAQGASAQLFDLGDGRVLKLFRSSVSDEMIAREAAVSAHAARCGIPTAAAIERQDRDGQRGIVYPRLDGPTAMAWIRKHPMRAAQMLDSMGAMHRAIHAAPAPADLRDLKQVIATDIAYGPAPATLQRAAIAYLESLPDDRALTHGDFHLGNAMMTPQGLAVIDWSKAAAGHRAADAVRSEMLMRFGVGPDDWITGLWRDWAARRMLRACLADGAIGADELDRWRPVVALAWLRARDAGRTPAFCRYLNAALARAGLPQA